MEVQVLSAASMIPRVYRPLVFLFCYRILRECPKRAHLDKVSGLFYFQCSYFEKYHKESSYHFLKDAIIFLNHGIEILMKYILSKQNESFIFTDIDLYMEAKEKLKNQSKGRKKPFLMLIWATAIKRYNYLNEAIKRIKFLLDIDLTENVEATITLINEYRNHKTHHSIILDESSVKELVEKIKFYKNIYLVFIKIISQKGMTSRKLMRKDTYMQNKNGNNFWI
ncbi:hypothetical protein [Bacillus sp. 179-C3.3 HS]|uniref:hypothetical protein n=1 Tax=Bacillus sp. 179-C3.3 HS TaxID=3232162 RepID=UPI0039A180C1